MKKHQITQIIQNTQTRFNLATIKRISPVFVTAIFFLSYICCAIFTNNLNENSAYAASAKTTINVSPTIRLTLTGGDLIINDLVPGTYADSNIITASVITNSSYGYYLSATTGVLGGSTNLTHSTNSNYAFTSLASNASSLSDFPADSNTWGYSYSTDNGTTWISGSQGNTTTGYNGLPLDHGDNGATGIILRNTDSYSSNTTTTKFKIGARSTRTQPSGTYTGVVNFYAVANPVPAVYIQDITYCPSVPTGVTDIRDNKTYRIQKLADGNCWMLDNLALDLVDPSVQANLNSDTTNASDATLGYLKNGGGTGQYAAAGVAYAGVSHSYNAPLIATSGTCYDAYCVNDPSDGQWSSNSVTQQTINGITSIAQGKIGVYYNYCAASAGSYCYASGSGTGNASQDICPAGWRLPTGGSSGEYRALYATYDNNYINFQTTFSTPLSGYFLSGAAHNQGEDGRFWTSTYSDGNYMQYLYINHNEVYPASIHYRDNDHSVRCLKTPTMQGATAAQLAAAMPNVGDTTTLADSRDGQEYTVAKLADGKYWMTENLNLAGGTALSATNTDVSADYINNFSTSNNLTRDGNTIKLPASSTSGFDTNNYSYVYNTGNKTTNCASPGCYSYYSWDAATLGSGRTISTDNTDAPYSICPKGWRLPTTRTGTDSTSDLRALMIALGGLVTIETYDATTIPTGDVISSNLSNTPPSLTMAGRYYDNTFYYGAYEGNYWSATSLSEIHSRGFSFNSTYVTSAHNYDRKFGFAVRCLFSGQ